MKSAVLLLIEMSETRQRYMSNAAGVMQMNSEMLAINSTDFLATLICKYDFKKGFFNLIFDIIRF